VEKNGWRRPAASLTVIMMFSAVASFPLLFPANRDASAIISFDSMKNLSANSGASVDPAILASGKSVYVVWSDKTSGNSKIIFRASTDGGETFTSKSKGRLSNTADASLMPKVVSAGSHVYVAWIEKDSFGKSDIYFRASHNSGSSFGDLENLSNSGTAGEPQVATTGEDVYVVWSDSKSGNRDIILHFACCISSSSDLNFVPHALHSNFFPNRFICTELSGEIKYYPEIDKEEL
jgi:hypothetical protein